MQVVCIRPFGLHDVGDLSQVPDGSAVDPWHWAEAPEAEAEVPAEPPPDAAGADAPAPAVLPLAPTEF